MNSNGKQKDYIKTSGICNSLDQFNNYVRKPTKNEKNEIDPPKEANIFTVIDIFLSRQEANNAVAEMQRQGLASPQIVIISKYYQEHQNSMYWEYISSDDRLQSVLIGIGVNVHETLPYLEAVDSGNFLVVGLVNDRTRSKAQQILNNIGRKAIAVY